MPETLPNADRAYIDLAKLRDYCLNPDHEVGQSKAKVFNHRWASRRWTLNG